MGYFWRLKAPEAIIGITWPFLPKLEPSETGRELTHPPHCGAGPAKSDPPGSGRRGLPLAVCRRVALLSTPPAG